MSWGTELWDQFDQVSLHMLRGINFCDHFGAFLKDLSVVENEYAAKLKKVIKNYLPKKTEETEFTYAKSFISMMNVLNDMAWQHEMIAENIVTQIVTDIGQLTHSLRLERKKFLQDGMKQQSALQNQLAELDKAKKHYEKSCHESNRAHEMYRKADTDIHQSRFDVEKAKNNSITKQRLCNESKNAYAAELQKTNQFQHEHFHSLMPKVFDCLQQMEERRVTKVQEYIQKLADIKNEVIPIINTCISGIVTAAKCVSPAKDTQLTIEKYKSGFQMPTDIPFEEQDSASVNYGVTGSPPASTVRSRLQSAVRMKSMSGASTRTRKQTGIFSMFTKDEDAKEDFGHLPPNQQKKKLVEKVESPRLSLAKQTAARDGLLKMQDVFSKNLRMDNPASLASALEENSKALDSLQQEIHKYEGYLAEAENRSLLPASLSGSQQSAQISSASTATNHDTGLSHPVEELRRYIDPDSGLIDHLLQNSVITHKQLMAIISHETCYERNDCLLRYISLMSANEHALFIKALKDTGQQHVVNYITDTFDPDIWPLDDHLLDDIHQNLDHLSTNIEQSGGLTDTLCALGCITLEHKRQIEDLASPNERNARLLDIMCRRSRADLKTFLIQLQVSGQHNLPDIFSLFARAFEQNSSRHFKRSYWQNSDSSEDETRLNEHGLMVLKRPRGINSALDCMINCLPYGIMEHLVLVKATTGLCMKLKHNHQPLIEAMVIIASVCGWWNSIMTRRKWNIKKLNLKLRTICVIQFNEDSGDDSSDTERDIGDWWNRDVSVNDVRFIRDDDCRSVDSGVGLSLKEPLSPPVTIYCSNNVLLLTGTILDPHLAIAPGHTMKVGKTVYVQSYHDGRTSRREIGRCIGKVDNICNICGDQITADIGFILLDPICDVENVVFYPKREENVACRRLRLRMYKEKNVESNTLVMICNHLGAFRFGTVGHGHFTEKTGSTFRSCELYNVILICDRGEKPTAITEHGDSGALVMSLPRDDSDDVFVFGFVIGMIKCCDGKSYTVSNSLSSIFTDGATEIDDVLRHRFNVSSAAVDFFHN